MRPLAMQMAAKSGFSRRFRPVRAIAGLGLILALTVGAGAGASAQTAGSDEAVNPNGAVAGKLTLTAAQKSAIYNAVLQQRVRIRGANIAATIGAPVPASAELRDLPGQGTDSDDSTPLLKYAMVENNVVVVDPFSMRVVEVIREGVKP